MSTGILSSQPYGSHEGHQNVHSVFRGHAFSFIVSSSVLLGSMLTAHSAIVEMASINAGERILSFVVETRTHIAEMPHRAAANMAAAVEAQARPTGLDYSRPYDRFSFSSGLEGLFAPYISLISQEPVETALAGNENAYFESFYQPQATVAAAEASRPPVPELLYQVFELVATIAEPYIALSLAALQGAGSMEDRAMEIYVAGIYGWVDTSHKVATAVFTGTYSIGDRTIEVATNGMPALHLEEMPALTLWVATAQELARMASVPQLALGERILSSVDEARAQSAVAQDVAGELLVDTVAEVVSAGVELARMLPRTATASVADFLILEAR